MTARLSRPERRALQREDEAFLPLPLKVNPDTRSVTAHVRHIVRLLRDPQATSPCSGAVAHVAGLFDRSVPETAEAPLACSKGCSYCCSQMVTLTAPEAFFVAAQLRKRPQTVAAAVQAHGLTGGLTVKARLRCKVACPMLEDGVCSVYAARPLSCHGFVSMDLNACIAGLAGGEPPNIPMPGQTVAMLDTCRMLYTAALRIAGLPETLYEMNQALVTIFATEGAEARWLAGEDVLASVAQGPPPPRYDTPVAQIAALVAPTV